MKTVLCTPYILSTAKVNEETRTREKSSKYRNSEGWTSTELRELTKHQKLEKKVFLKSSFFLSGLNYLRSLLVFPQLKSAAIQRRFRGKKFVGAVLTFVLQVHILQGTRLARSVGGPRDCDS